MAQVPRTRYASCGDVDIAYQVFGEGPTDLLVLPGPSIPIDTIDAEPSMYRFHRRLASFARVIRLDQRGIGLSSRVPSLDVVGPKFWAKDAISVMNAVGSEQATILAPGFTGPQHHYVLQAALAALCRWVRTGQPAPSADPIKLSPTTNPPRPVTDANGLAQGGLRTPGWTF